MQNHWYIARDGKQYGPVSDEELAQLVRNRELLDGDYLWRQGFENWLPAGQVPEVRGFATMTAHPQPGMRPDQQPAHNIARDQQLALEQQLRQQHLQGAPQAHMANQVVSGGEAAGREFGAFQPHGGRLSADSPRFLAGAAEPAPQGYGHEGLYLPQAHPLHAVEEAQEARAEDIHELVEDDEAASADPYYNGEGGPYAETHHDDYGFEFSAQPDNHAVVQADYGHHDAEPEHRLGGVGHHYNGPDYQGADYQGTDYQALGADDHESMVEGGAFAAYGRQRASVSHEPDEEVTRGGKLSWPLAVGIGAAALLILMVGATFALPFIVPPETIKRQISAALKEQTGRDVSFKGKMSYRFFPSFGLDLNNIVIHNPPEIKGPDFLSVGRLQADLSLLPLLSKRVEIEKVALHRPEVVLITDGSGRTNYQFKSAAFERLKPLSKGFRVAQAETIDTGDIIARTLRKLEEEEAKKNAAEGGEAAKAADDGTAQEDADAVLKPDSEADTATDDPRGPAIAETALKAQPAKAADIQVGEIEIVNGAIKLIDQKANSETELNAINLTLTAPAADKDVTATGTVRFREDRIAVNASLSTLGPLLNGEVVDANLAMNSDRFEGKFKGKMKVGDGLEYQGEADVQTFSLKNLLSWFGVDVPKQGYGGGYVRGKLAGGGDVITLKDATFKLDQTTLIGSLRLRQQPTRPRIDAILKTDTLNLAPYLSQPNEIRRGSLENGRRTAVAAWNSEKIDLSFLQSFDGMVQLAAGRLVALGHPIEKGTVNVKVNAGLMTATIPSFEIYEGTGSLTMTLNGGQARTGLKGRVALNKVNVKPLLVNAAGLDWISGNADVVFDVTSAGSSEQEIIGGLNGTGKFTVLDGALEGINIPGMVRNLKSGNLLASSGTPSEKTDFSELSATFNIERGVVNNNDLLMKGPLVRMSGEGSINLPTEQIDYGLKPKLVSSLDGQGGAADLSGINIPLRLKGPLSNPKIVPDAKGLLDNNEAAITNTVEGVKKVVKDLKKKKISSEEMKGLLNGMIGGDGDQKNLDKIFQ